MIEQIIKNLTKNRKVYLSGLWGSANSFVLQKLFEQTNKNFIALTADNKSAYSLYNDSKFFLNKYDNTDILFLNEPENRLYEEKNPSLQDETNKINILYKLLNPEKRVLLITPIYNFMLKLIPKDKFLESIIKINKGDDIDFETLINTVIEYGYKRTDKVFVTGDFSIRGDILNIFLPTLNHPVQFQFFDNIVDNIRLFSPATQDTIALLKNVNITPCSELILDNNSLENFNRAVNRKLKEEKSKIENPNNIWATNYVEFDKLLNSSGKIRGYHNFLPLFYEKMNSLFDYIDENFIFYIIDWQGIKEKIKNELQILDEKQKEIIKYNKPCLPLNELIIEGEVIEKRLENYKVLFSSIISLSKKDKQIYFKIKNIPKYNGEIVRLKNELLQKKIEYTFLAKNEKDLKEIKSQIDNRYNFKIGEIENSFIAENFNIGFIQHKDIYNDNKQVSKKKSLFIESLNDISELKEGDYVVHIHNGIGIYRGLKHIDDDKIKGDFFELEYYGGMKLLVPIENMNLIHRYIGINEQPPQLNKLGTSSFSRTKAKIKKSVTEVAKELLKIYAIRQNRIGIKFKSDKVWEKEFDNSFPHIETPDQLKAIEDVKNDMEKDMPMDRLICGDVGYGKTEIAMRAAFKAVISGKQVAFLVPTTILALQHYNTLSDRLKNFPIKVGMLSRFNSYAEQKKILRDVKEGLIDIVIGTHRLLQPDVKFNDLGLIIIDEEHRFGVMHKEKLKMLRSTVDVISMSATPIPRTLYMALSGIRDISLVNTPPKGKLPIKTEILRFSPEVIKKVIEYELKRNGQVYFVHNRVQSIKIMTDYLKKLVPDAKIEFIHGQMDEDEIELTMLDFFEKKFDVLVSTTIIESGIDIPDVNTIIINRADTFGLSQLYQLRGRVGRADKQAYAYFLVPSDKALSEISQKRLNAIFQYSDLGSGYNIAMKDLEIRGAGNVFGPQQHGNILSVGLEMYCKILEQVIERLKGEEIEDDIEPELDFKYKAYIPDGFVKTKKDKFELYKKLNRLKTIDEFTKFVKEFKKHYQTPLPAPVNNILHLYEIKIMAKLNGITKIKEVDKKNYEYIIMFEFNNMDSVRKKKIKDKLRNSKIEGSRLFIPIEKKKFLLNLKKMLQLLF